MVVNHEVLGPLIKTAYSTISIPTEKCKKIHALITQAELWPTPFTKKAGADLLTFDFAVLYDDGLCRHLRLAGLGGCFSGFKV